jgi:hypothetical protein
MLRRVPGGGLVEEARSIAQDEEAVGDTGRDPRARSLKFTLLQPVFVNEVVASAGHAAFAALSRFLLV